jgi:hypothetical protein
MSFEKKSAKQTSSLTISSAQNNTDNKCIICYESNHSFIAYYDCSKMHNLCKNCFENHDDNSSTEGSKCPMCNAKLLKENANPSSLSILELKDIDIKTIKRKHIFIHQNFKLKKSNNTIVSDNNITFYISNGEIMKYMRMFVAQNGFLYLYNEQYECYHIAVHKDRYQFWDASRISLNL